MATRNIEIDYLRSFAIIFVLALHLSDIAYGGTSIPNAIRSNLNLQAGVDIFFAVSGFVISGSLHKFWIGADNPIKDYGIFLTKRFFRLWPAMSFWLVSWVIFAGLTEHTYGWISLTTALNRTVAGLLYLSNFAEHFDGHSAMGHFWSLAVEWQFYLFLPLVLFLFNKRDNLRFYFIAVLCLLSAITRPGGDDWSIFRVDALGAGIIVYMLVNRWNAKFHVNVSSFGSLIFTLGTLFACAFLPLSGMSGTSLQLLTSFLSGLLVLVASQKLGIISDVFSPSAMNWIGERSYSLYLGHITAAFISVIINDNVLYLIGATDQTILSRTSLFLLMVFLSCLFAEFSYRYIELPFNEYGHALAKKLGRDRNTNQPIN